MKYKFLYLFLLCICMLPMVMSTCQISLSKAVYAPSETALATLVCSEVVEKATPYQINWTNSSGYVLQSTTGTTPNPQGTLFYSSYNIPLGYSGLLNINMTGTNLEGNATANVTGAASNALLITSIQNYGKWLGLSSSTRGIVKTSAGKKVTGALCHVHVYDATGLQTLFTASETSLDGDIAFTGVADYRSFKEGLEYKNTIHCYCDGNNSGGSGGSGPICINEDGVPVFNSVGSADSAFTMNTWVTWQDNMPIAYVNGTLANSNAVFFAGYGNKVYFINNKTNNFGQNLIVRAENFIIDNATGYTYYAEQPTSFSLLSQNTSMTRLRGVELPASLPTGLYYVRTYYNVVYQDLIVAEYILKTNTFNITGTDKSFQFSNVLMDKTNYYTGEDLHICANITSTYNTRVEFEISYRYRCGSATDTSQQAAIDSYTEIRGINPGATQVRCANLNIPYKDILAYKTSSCQAIVTVKSDFVNTFDNKITLQGTTFNITDFGMYPEYEKDPTYPIVRLYPDWRRFDNIIDGVSKSYYRAKINITKLNEVDLDNTNIVGDADWDVYVSFTDKMPCSQEIFNYTVKYANGTVITNPIENKALQWKNGDLTSRCSIGIENVNFSDTSIDYFEVLVWFEDFMERQTNALEGINISGGRQANALEGINISQALSSGTLIQINTSLINMNNFLGGINTTLTNSTGLLNSISNWLSNIKDSFLNLVGIQTSMNTTATQSSLYLGGINSSLYSSSLYLWNINGSLVATSTYNNLSQYYLGALSNTAATSSGYLYSINGSLYLSRVALQDIANKTGTFKMNINCPATGVLGDNIRCTIEAQIEASQVVEKEVSFTCYIKNSSGDKSSTMNFNQMITRNLTTITKDFLVLNLPDGSSNQVFCEAGYYNFGSRIDTFYDTFIARNPVTTAGGPALEYLQKVYDEANKLFTPKGEEPKSKWFMLFIFLVIVFFIIVSFSMICLFIYHKRKNIH